MDIMMPPLRQQASPAPWLLRREKVDLARLISAALTIKPDATIDEVVAQLECWGAQVSGIVVGMWMSQIDSPPLNAADISSMTLVEKHDGVSRLDEKRNVQYVSAT
jgi:hypothetical protein